MTTKTRTCNECNQTRPLHLFAPHARGYRKTCRLCLGEDVLDVVVMPPKTDVYIPRFTVIYHGDEELLVEMYVNIRRRRNVTPQQRHDRREFYRRFHNVMDAVAIYRMDGWQNYPHKATQAAQTKKQALPKASTLIPAGVRQNATVGDFTHLDDYAELVAGQLPMPKPVTRKALDAYFKDVDVSDRAWFDQEYPSIDLALVAGERWRKQYGTGKATYYIREGKRGWVVIAGVSAPCMASEPQTMTKAEAG